jgi:tryptophanyl-tRNA synthetase
MRPTGRLHLGHVVGALANWTKLQESYDCCYFVADWHALMSEHAHPQVIRDSTLDNVADWLACGVDPEKCVLFVQSHVPAHLELYMALSCVTPVAWLERCPTYKEALREFENTERDVRNYAFLGYPCLQAADILLYRAEAVPVGEDQVPHLELTREIARRYNAVFGELFPEPQAVLTRVPRLAGLDGRKMSKSYGNCIHLSDDPKEVAARVMTMFTDPKRVKRSDAGHPDECNVCAYWRTFAPDRAEEVAGKCRAAAWGCTDCKRALAAVLSDEVLAPIQKARAKWPPERVAEVLAAGTERARALAGETIAKVKAAVGLWRGGAP